MGEKMAAIAISFQFVGKRNAFPEPQEDHHFHMTVQNCEPIRDLDRQLLVWDWGYCCPKEAQGLLARKERMGWGTRVCHSRPIQ